MKKLTPYIGKAVRTALRLRGGGSALPGLVVERFDKDFVPHVLSQLPHGVVVISGTNGKTTTTKMVVELLESQGLRVFTNKSGSNFIRGVAASLLGEINARGELDADIAVLELDEAHAVHFVKLVQPRYCLLLNVMRDQLDRFGEIDAVASMLRQIAEATTDTVIINREDPRLLKIGTSLNSKRVVYFGLHASLRSAFPSDDDMHGSTNIDLPQLPAAEVILKSVQDSAATFSIKGTQHSSGLRITGTYNIYNAAAALCLARTIVTRAKPSELMHALAHIEPAFGRGERFMIHDQSLELVLVKNPAGFRLALQSFRPDKTATMIAINDNYADSRDMSWLWDVDFTSLQGAPIDLSGMRAYDIALRLDYDDVPVGHIEQDLEKALKKFIATHTDAPKRIFCTYTAMLELRRRLKRYTEVEQAL